MSQPTERILIGVSSCLLGEEVRFDGGHKRNSFVSDTLAEFFDFQPYCPEMAIGLGIPRPTIRLIERDGRTHLVDSRDDSIDHTTAMASTAREYCASLPSDISGYIVKSRSPSCGMERVNLFNDKGMPTKTGIGIFTAELLRMHPQLPVEEEGRLNDARLRENFIERVFVFHRWTRLLKAGINAAALMDFHRVHKFIIQAHDEATGRELGQLVAGVSADNCEHTAQTYFTSLMKALSRPASRGSHINVLQHIMGFLKKDLSTDDKQELLDLFDAFHRGQSPLVVPLTLINHHLRKHPKPYINDQLYLHPYPAELMLRNHV